MPGKVSSPNWYYTGRGEPFVNCAEGETNRGSRAGRTLTEGAYGGTTGHAAAQTLGRRQRPDSRACGDGAGQEGLCHRPALTREPATARRGSADTGGPYPTARSLLLENPEYGP